MWFEPSQVKLSLSGIWQKSAIYPSTAQTFHTYPAVSCGNKLWRVGWLCPVMNCAKRHYQKQPKVSFESRHCCYVIPFWREDKESIVVYTLLELDFKLSLNPCWVLVVDIRLNINLVDWLKTEGKVVSVRENVSVQEVKYELGHFVQNWNVWWCVA